MDEQTGANKLRSVLPGAPIQDRHTVGPFEVLDCIDKRANSAIYRARFFPGPGDPMELLPLPKGTPVVLKIATGEKGTPSWEAVQREIYLLERMDHPGLPSYFAKGQYDGELWSAMEYIEGEHLGNVMYALKNSGMRIRPELATLIVSDVAEALACLHALCDSQGKRLGVLHGDVAPGNILIEISGRTRLIDFGNAGVDTAEAAGVSGTPGYLAPEQARGEQQTAATDVYALGVLFFELMTGERAYPVENLPDEAILNAHAQGERAQWPADVEIPDALRKLCSRFLSERMMRRPKDATAAAKLLREFVKNETEHRETLSMMATDLVRSNRNRPPPILV